MTVPRIILLALAVASCTPAAPIVTPPPVLPVPPPVALPVPPPVIPSGYARLQLSYETAAAQLHTYFSQGACAPSGPIGCVDHDQAKVANEAQRVAHGALAAAKRRETALRVAALRVAAFQAVVAKLQIEGSSP